MASMRLNKIAVRRGRRSSRPAASSSKASAVRSARVVRSARPVVVGGGVAAAKRGASVTVQAAKGPNEMESFMTYLSTAPVLIMVVGAGLSGLIIEVNRFFPDLLTLSMMS